jgi:MFS-type transporter involved in bile tolerance (Atg22 family)
LTAVLPAVGIAAPVVPEPSATGQPVASLRGQLSWTLFEWARAPYVTLVAMYVFAP